MVERRNYVSFRSGLALYHSLAYMSQDEHTREFKHHSCWRQNASDCAEVLLQPRFTDKGDLRLPLITTQSSPRLRKLAVIRPTCSQTETSSRAALDVSIALKYCASQVSLHRGLRIPRHFFPTIDRYVDASQGSLLKMYDNVVLSGAKGS